MSQQRRPGTLWHLQRQLLPLRQLHLQLRVQRQSLLPLKVCVFASFYTPCACSCLFVNPLTYAGLLTLLYGWLLGPRAAAPRCHHMRKPLLLPAI
jgi:hypothetical protein